MKKVKMKKLALLFFTVLMGMSLAFVSCDKDDDDNDATKLADSICNCYTQLMNGDIEEGEAWDCEDELWAPFENQSESFAYQVYKALANCPAYSDYFED